MDIELIQIDGKTKRGSYDREKGLNAGSIPDLQ
jgi:hypothetical protein